MTSSEQDPTPISFEEFRDLVAEELQVDRDDAVREASFLRDLQADSLQLVDMMLRMEEMGIRIPMESAWEIDTVGDAYQVYVDHFGGNEKD